MTPEEQNAAIAKLMGKIPSCGRMVDDPHIWSPWIHQPGSLRLIYRKCNRCTAIHMQGERFVSIGDGDECPNYLEDLNAMREAEENLTNMQRRFYAEKLVAVHPLHYDPTRDGEDRYIKLFLIAHTTAAQRAEAFLRAKGCWMESATEPTVSKP